MANFRFGSNICQQIQPKSTVLAANAYLQDAPRKIGREILAHDTIARHIVATEVDARHILYMQRQRFGRICSCWENQTLLPESSCPVCFGTGRVGGYNKRGTRWSLLDCTHSNWSCQGATLIVGRPHFWRMTEQNTEAHIDFCVELQPNRGIVDVLELGGQGDMGILFRWSSQDSWQPVTIEALEAGLSKHSQLFFRVTLSRKNLSEPLPQLGWVWFRYVVSDFLFAVDCPQSELNISFQDLGLFDVRSSRTFYAPATIEPVSTEDLVWELDTNCWYKILSVKPSTHLGITVSNVLEARNGQSWEGFARYPIGLTKE